MTDEQKDILIAKMMDAPSSLSDKELESILSDEELRDIFEMSAAVSGAYIDHPDFDMDKEWNMFRPKLRRKPMKMRWAMRVAAIFLGVVFVGAIMVRIIDNAFDAPRQIIAKVQDTQESAEIKQIEEDIKSEDIPKEDDSQSLIQRNNTASSGQCASNAKTMKTEQMEMPEEEMDIDEYLRIQQARIDNDLAMMAAESYIYEYNEFMQDLEDPNAYDTTELENRIRQVTMQ